MYHLLPCNRSKMPIFQSIVNTLYTVNQLYRSCNEFLLQGNFEKIILKSEREYWTKSELKKFKIEKDMIEHLYFAGINNCTYTILGRIQYQGEPVYFELLNYAVNGEPINEMFGHIFLIKDVNFYFNYVKTRVDKEKLSSLLRKEGIVTTEITSTDNLHMNLKEYEKFLENCRMLNK